MEKPSHPETAIDRLPEDLRPGTEALVTQARFVELRKPDFGRAQSSRRPLCQVQQSGGTASDPFVSTARLGLKGSSGDAAVLPAHTSLTLQDLLSGGLSSIRSLRPHDDRPVVIGSWDQWRLRSRRPAAGGNGRR